MKYLFFYIKYFCQIFILDIIHKALAKAYSVKSITFQNNVCTILKYFVTSEKNRDLNVLAALNVYFTYFKFY